MDEFERIMTHPKGLESDIGEHWIWNGARNNSGYGVLGRTSVHRASYEHFKGEIPEKCEVMHSCDIRECFRPDHLSVGTKSDNFRDMQFKTRGNTTILTPEQVLEIREYTKGKKRYGRKALAAKYGIAESTLKQVVSGLHWGWL